MKTGKETFKNHSRVLTLKVNVKCWYTKETSKTQNCSIFNNQPTEYTDPIIVKKVIGV